MSDDRQGRVAFRNKSVELAVATLFFIVGAVVISDSQRLGSGWAADGPRPGYFPFYVGLLICIASVVNFVTALRLRGDGNRPFVHVGQLKMVLTVLTPTAIYAGLVTWIGIYASSALFIGFFMRWLGRYAWWKVVLVSIGTVVVFYVVFETWFKVPLPKGPLESWLRIN